MAEQPWAQVGPGLGLLGAAPALRIIFGEPGLQAEAWVPSSNGEQGWDQEEVVPLIRGRWCPSPMPGPSCPSSRSYCLGR